jgi:hypothetical protein
MYMYQCVRAAKPGEQAAPTPKFPALLFRPMHIFCHCHILLHNRSKTFFSILGVCVFANGEQIISFSL